MIDTSKLVVGNVYSYKELCELTGAEYTSGQSKTAQLNGFGENGFHRFFEFEKIKRGKFLITYIYDKELPLAGKSKGNNSVYSTYIELILMHYLSQNENHVAYFTRRNLWVLLGMTNEKYGNISNDELMLIDKCITTYEINHFYVRCNRKLEKILLSALGNLRNRRLIDYDLQTVICIDKNGKEEWFVATENERKDILNIEYQVLHELGFEKMIQVFSSYQQDKYFTRVNELLYKKYKWKRFYKRIKLIYNKDNIIESIPSVEISLNKALLNTKVADFLNHEADEIYKKAIAQYDKTLECAIENGNEQEIFIAMNRWKPPINYILAQNLLTDELIKTECNNNLSLNTIISYATSDPELDILFT